jgi:hypothetical protein
MNSSALVMMFVAEGIIAAITIYFFIRVLNAPPKPEPDSYEDNDDVKR